MSLQQSKLYLVLKAFLVLAYTEITQFGSRSFDMQINVITTHYSIIWIKTTSVKFTFYHIIYESVPKESQYKQDSL